MTITPAQIKQIYEANPEVAFQAIADAVNPQFQVLNARVKSEIQEKLDERSKRASLAVSREVMETGKIPDDHANDKFFQELAAVKGRLDEANAKVESMGDYEEMKANGATQLALHADLEGKLKEANTRLGKHEAKELRSWHEAETAKAVTAHGFPVAKDMIPALTDQIAPFMVKTSEGVSLMRDGKPLTLDGAAVEMKGLLEDVNTGGRIVERTYPSMFTRAQTGPNLDNLTSEELNESPLDNVPSVALDAALEANDLDAINAAT